MHSAMLLSLNYRRSKLVVFFNACMLALSKQTRMLNEVAGHHAQRKRAHNLRLATQFLDDLPSSDALAHPNSDLSSSLSSLSSISSPSSGTSDSSSSSPHSSHSEHSPSIFGDLDSLEDTLLDRWDTQTQELAAYLLTTCVLEACPLVKKLGQLGLYLTDFRDDHP